MGREHFHRLMQLYLLSEEKASQNRKTGATQYTITFPPLSSPSVRFSPCLNHYPTSYKVVADSPFDSSSPPISVFLDSKVAAL
jgi:hypothetical protein